MNITAKQFVLISEFCEKTGPSPVFIYPPSSENPQAIKWFVLQLMTTNYSQSLPFENTEGESFVIKISNRYAFVHRFTLLDIQARGFTRNFCFAFVGRSYRKLMQQFILLFEETKKLLSEIELNNKLLFILECEKKLLDLEFSKKQIEKDPEDVPKFKIKIFIEYIEQKSLEIQDNINHFYSKSTTHDFQILFQEISQEFSIENKFDPNLEINEQRKKFAGIIQQNYKAKYIGMKSPMDFTTSLRNYQEICLSNAFQFLHEIYLKQFFDKFSITTLQNFLHMELNTQIEPEHSLLLIGGFPMINFLPHFGETLEMKTEYFSPIFGNSFDFQLLDVLKNQLRYSKEHLIYSLLIGRPVVIYASKKHENYARFLVKNLSLFVVGNLSRFSVLNWSNKPLSESDLAHFKLGSFPNNVAFKDEIKSRVTFYDYESGLVFPKLYYQLSKNKIQNQNQNSNSNSKKKSWFWSKSKKTTQEKTPRNDDKYLCAFDSIPDFEESKLTGLDFQMKNPHFDLNDTFTIIDEKYLDKMGLNSQKTEIQDEDLNNENLTQENSNENLEKDEWIPIQKYEFIEKNEDENENENENKNQIKIKNEIQIDPNLIENNLSSSTKLDYSKCFINKLLALNHNWKDEKTYYAHIHQKLLEISSCAFLYFHQNHFINDEVFLDQISSISSFPKDFVIIKYLTQFIRKQQLGSARKKQTKQN
ncbi:hypothetical protein M0811_10925 [Anaeramoeba ignava]|uniref:UDENN FLCN/SMCR8-type domain-containing protein n=1 Tax=Anaeramoeba ignava TaxID=1746090 RepID=A0A9Q0R8J2_ANAIG|nr:hypothetical protein M0811_10925 [Anaeramoeba ignava]